MSIRPRRITVSLLAQVVLASVLLWRARLILRFGSVTRLARWTHVGEEQVTISQVDLEWAHGWFEAIRLAARLQGNRPQCLPKSLALAMRLRARGLPAKVVFGVQQHKAALHSHAWVVINETVIGESEHALADFTPVDLSHWLASTHSQ